MTSLAPSLEWGDYDGISIASVNEKTDVECVYLDREWLVQIVVDREHIIQIGLRQGRGAAKSRAQYVADVLRIMQEKTHGN